jgi:hypothetical protein
MSKRKLTNREQLRKRLKDAEPNSILYQELVAIQASIEKPHEKYVPELIRLLKVATTQEAKHFIAILLGSTKDLRVIKPLVISAGSPENETYRSGYLWPLELNNYDCTQYLPQLVSLLLSRAGFDEVTWVCIELIRKMKGPLEPALARKCIRKLLAEIRQPLTPKELTSTHANRLEAADKIMSIYFNQTVKTYWAKWNKGEWKTAED